MQRRTSCLRPVLFRLVELFHLMPSNIFASVFDSLSTHRVHSSKDRHWREMAGFPHSRVAHKASEFYSLAMVNKNQWILGGCALLFLQSVRQFTARQGLRELLKYSLSLVPHRVYDMSEVFCNVTLQSYPKTLTLG